MSNIDMKPLPIEVQPYRMHGYDGGNTFFRQWVYRFPNDWGASIIQATFSYGGKEEMHELAVLRFEGDRSEVSFETSIARDVLGWLTIEGIAETLAKIAALPREGVAS